jgi:hypothetical protein
MSHFRTELRQRAEKLLAPYPRKRLAKLRLLHLVQERDVYLSVEVIDEIAELTGTNAADVRANGRQQRRDDGELAVDCRRRGAAFSALGAGRSTVARLFALASRVKKPLIYEIELVKNTFRDLFYDPELGGGIIGDEKIKAFIPGGDFAQWFGPDLMDLPLGQDEVSESSSMHGSGSVGVMDETSCVVRATWRITKFFSKESCGQCTPCREGSGWIERAMYRLEHGGGRTEDLELRLYLCAIIAPGLTWPSQ